MLTPAQRLRDDRRWRDDETMPRQATRSIQVREHNVIPPPGTWRSTNVQGRSLGEHMQAETVQRKAMQQEGDTIREPNVYPQVDFERKCNGDHEAKKKTPAYLLSHPS